MLCAFVAACFSHTPVTQSRFKETPMSTQALMPRDPVPALNAALTSGGRFVLGANPGEHFDLVVFFRGLHCPATISGFAGRH